MLDRGNNTPTGTATNHYLIAPSDTVDLTVTPRALYVCGGGALRMTDAQGIDVTYPFVSGQLNFQPARVLATGTTATGIIGWY